ncbi:methyltransferase domain-containing protein [Pseudochryseolinea flava]|uniref:SAM-dependent methyltransferase n=1 Tax=Pseudochryseolinea flava TaxID=2059302 RepID=A0A364Y7X0_9BACT|nr:methyltransferase domain-containing protein [Pseudochryseolinea flava]RAW03206.1 SAM-dependent methyltransferase [Pseudochryseolinea flava]
MPNFNVRSDELEVMDDLNCAGEVVRQTLHELEVINTWLGGNAVTMDGVKKLFKNIATQKEIVIADLGCGRGDMLLSIDRWALRNGYRVKLLGFDANPNIVAEARSHARSNPRITFEVLDIFSARFQELQFDVVTGTLFYHHFTSDQLAAFFTALRKRVKIGILVNDIHRHPLAYYSIKLLTGWFSRSPMVKADAPLSVMRAFHKHELKEIFSAAGFRHVEIRWKWAFRWQVIAHA